MREIQCESTGSVLVVLVVLVVLGVVVASSSDTCRGTESGTAGIAWYVPREEGISSSLEIPVPLAQ